jgi:NAD-dependent SIR2 family protein deacetylase
VTIPAELDRFLYQCPAAPTDTDRWHKVRKYTRQMENAVCCQCKRPLKPDAQFRNWIYAIEPLLIEEEPA